MTRFVSLALLAVLIWAPCALASETGFDEAMKAYSRGDYAQVVNDLKGYVAEHPEARAYYVLGYASYALKQNREAAGYFKQAYLIDPGFDPGQIGFVYKKNQP
jgi:TolA-binding protein